MTDLSFEHEGAAPVSGESQWTVDPASADSVLPDAFPGLPAETENEAIPDALFDADFYLAQLPAPAEAGGSPRKHFAEHGRAAGYAPSLGAVYIGEAIRERARVSETPMGDIIGLLPPRTRHMAKTAEVWKRLRFCAHPRLYSAQFATRELEELGGAFDVDRAVSHYLAYGIHEGKRLCALFNPNWYLEQLDGGEIEIARERTPLLRWLAERHHKRVAKRSPFFHWLAIGWTWRIVPTPLFHQGFYEERYPEITTSYPWSFVHYVKRGCYQEDRLASPFGRHHPGGADPDAKEHQAPLLLREMLYRADDYDLSRTSWAEEGARVALTKYEALGSARMTELVAEAAAIEPLILQPHREYPVAGVPPYRGRRLFLDRQAEELRRAVERVHVDAVVLVPGGATEAASAILEPLVAHVGPDSLLVVATDAAGTPEESRAPENAYFDLLPFLGGMEQDFRVDLLLDLVRGLTAERIVVVQSELGWELLATYGRQLSGRASLGAYLPLAKAENGSGPAVPRLQECLPHLDWVLVDTALAERLVPLGEHAVERALELPRRRQHD